MQSNCKETDPIPNTLVTAYWLPFDPCFVAAAQSLHVKILLIGREGQTASTFALWKQVRSLE